MKDYYYILGVKPDASVEEIKTAYRKLSQKLHPDKNDGDDFFTERFKNLQEAWEVLGNEFSRNNYDYEKFGGKNKNDVHKPEIISFKVNQLNFDLNDELIFTWETKNADVITLQPFGTVPAAGTKKYRIKAIRSAILHFELAAENSKTEHLETSLITLTKRDTYTPPPQQTEKFELYDWLIANKKLIINISEVIAVLLAIFYVIVLFLLVIKLSLNQNSYEPLSIKYFLNEFGGNWKAFKDWVYEPQSYETLNTLTGWIFKIIFRWPSALIFFFIFMYFLAFFFRFLFWLIATVSTTLRNNSRSLFRCRNCDLVIIKNFLGLKNAATT